MSELYKAMTKAFSEMENAEKDRGNSAFKVNGNAMKYATLESVVGAIKPALIANGLFFRQVTHDQSGGVCIETFVCHATGDELSFGKLFVPASKQDAQGYGSALTYARRYSLMAAFGICPEDDDGNSAVQVKPKPVEPQFTELSDIDIQLIDGIQASATLADLSAFWAMRVDEIKASKNRKTLEAEKDQKKRAFEAENNFNAG
jgi:ERF superfamily